MTVPPGVDRRMAVDDLREVLADHDQVDAGVRPGAGLVARQRAALGLLDVELQRGRLARLDGAGVVEPHELEGLGLADLRALGAAAAVDPPSRHHERAGDRRCDGTPLHRPEDRGSSSTAGEGVVGVRRHVGPDLQDDLIVAAQRDVGHRTGRTRRPLT